jgi:hypothetical protein
MEAWVYCTDFAMACKATGSLFSRMLKQSASTEKTEVQVKAKMEQAEYSLNLYLDLSL